MKKILFVEEIIISNIFYFMNLNCTFLQVSFWSMPCSRHMSSNRSRPSPNLHFLLCRKKEGLSSLRFSTALMVAYMLPFKRNYAYFSCYTPGRLIRASFSKISENNYHLLSAYYVARIFSTHISYSYFDLPISLSLENKIGNYYLIFYL